VAGWDARAKKRELGAMCRAPHTSFIHRSGDDDLPPIDSYAATFETAFFSTPPWDFRSPIFFTSIDDCAAFGLNIKDVGPANRVATFAFSPAGVSTLVEVSPAVTEAS
jgi:hypothetical protein